MKKQLLFCVLLGSLASCAQEADVQPSTGSLAKEVAGKYQTNFYLDPSCVAIPASQMPYAEIRAESDSSVTMIYTKLYPAKMNRVVGRIRLVRQPAGIDLRLADSIVGTLRTERIFANNGMEKQGQLLRIMMGQTDPQNFLYFAGTRP